MSRLFEGRKTTLLVLSEGGPVGRSVEEQAQDVVEAMHRQVERIFGDRMDEETLGDLLDSVNYRMFKGPDGPYAVIGIRDRGEAEVYLVQKEGREQIFTNAIREALG